MSSSELYEKDFFAWANEQARLIREGRVGEADLENIAEEIESMGRGEKRLLVSRLDVLLLHLLKWQYQPARRGNSWRLSIQNARDALTDHLADNPSLKSRLAEAQASAYRSARLETSIETGLDVATLPTACPWSFEQVMEADFWPES